jgi:hypothetical protein
MARMWCPLCTLVVCGRLQCRPIDRPCACCSCHCWLCTSCSLLARTQLLHRWASKASTSRSLCVAEDTYEDIAYTGVTVGTAYPPTHAADLLQACDLRLSTFPDTMTCVKCKAYPDQVHDDGDHLGGVTGRAKWTSHDWEAGGPASMMGNGRPGLINTLAVGVVTAVQCSVTAQCSTIASSIAATRASVSSLSQERSRGQDPPTAGWQLATKRLPTRRACAGLPAMRQRPASHMMHPRTPTQP